MLSALAVSAAGGCATHQTLLKNTVAANVTTADIYYQETLENVARFAANPAAMPSFSVISAGTVNVEDEHSGGVNPNYSPTLTRAMQGGGALPILSILFQANARRSITENWSTTPVTDSDNLRRMRCAFQYLVGTETSECDRCKARLEGFFLGGTEPFECMLPRGWFNVGSKHDVPKDACFVANYCDTYVWVTAAGLDGFTRFTITVLDIATGEIHAPQRTVVKKYKGEAEGGEPRNHRGHRHGSRSRGRGQGVGLPAGSRAHRSPGHQPWFVLRAALKPPAFPRRTVPKKNAPTDPSAFNRLPALQSAPLRDLYPTARAFSLRRLPPAL